MDPCREKQFFKKIKQFVMIFPLFFYKNCDTMTTRENICCANEQCLVGINFSKEMYVK